jgi:hypothetical protein
MILGMSTSTFTLLHVLISLAGIATGLVTLFGMIAGKRLSGWTAVFLTTTVLTSVTGFGFPFEQLLPAHIVGIISLVVLALAIPGRYLFHMAGPWRLVYVISASIALYLNVFVGVVQAFRRVPALRASAPTQTEPSFVFAQVVVLLVFTGLTILALMKFRETPIQARSQRASA